MGFSADGGSTDEAAGVYQINPKTVDILAAAIFARRTELKTILTNLVLD